MWRRAATTAAAASGALSRRPWLPSPFRHSSSAAAAGEAASVSSAVNSMLLRSLEEHYLEVSKMSPPPKINPPSPFTVVKGSIDDDGPVLKGTYNDEEISIYVARSTPIIRGGPNGGSGCFGVDNWFEDEFYQLFLHVSVSKPQQDDSLLFLCGMYPDALGIHSVSVRPKAEASGVVVVPSKYSGPVLEELDEKVRDTLHDYIEERGIDERLFPLLQAWLYVKEHRNLIQWFKSVGTFISEEKPLKDTLKS